MQFILKVLNESVISLSKVSVVTKLDISGRNSSIEFIPFSESEKLRLKIVFNVYYIELFDFSPNNQYNNQLKDEKYLLTR